MQPKTHDVFDLRVLRDPSWIQWAVVTVLLWLHAIGVHYALAAAVVLCAGVAAAVALRLDSMRPYAVQIRYGHLAFLVAGLLPPTAWIIYIPLPGTTARVLTGYCPMSRLLMLMPWNRTQPLTWSRVRQVVLAPQRDGGILRLGGGDAPASPIPSCRMTTPPRMRIATCTDTRCA